MIGRPYLANYCDYITSAIGVCKCGNLQRNLPADAKK